MFLALFFIVGDFLARAPFARLGAAVFWALLVVICSVCLPSPAADLATAVVVFLGGVAATWLDLKGDTMRRRFSAAVVAWEMGFDSRAAWKWSREFMGK
jgi:hypothetical protein